MPKFSVIVPCYNAEHKLNHCLSALVGQTCRDLEAVFVDDCSIDGTLKKLETFREQAPFSVQIIAQEENAGPGAARNRGIAAAKGEYLCFCDCDDWYADTFLEKMANALSGGKDLAICRIALTTPDGHTAPYTRIDRDKVNSVSYLAAVNDGSLCNLAVHRQLFHGLQIPDIYHGEDLAIVPVVISRAKTFSYVDEALYYYLVHGDSLSQGVSREECFSFIDAFRFQEKEVDSSMQAELEYNGIKNVIYGFTLNAFKAGMPQYEVREQIDAFEKAYPRWRCNRYLQDADLKKRIYYFLAAHRLWGLNRAYARLHEWYMRRSKA
ncbi:MAG: glycosyltransferase family 2 protein [Oscillospiraceae bacterium]|nr:glycosyltransferase family 2 protein [Oscillospiraceae bacterium]